MYTFNANGSIKLFRFSACSLITLLMYGLACVATHSQADDKPSFGRAMSIDEVTALPAHVFADGSGLPEGSGMAVKGAQLYTQHCADCHGSVGQGGRALELVGDRTLLASDIPDRGIAVFWPYAPTLFEYVRRAMPPQNPYSLSVNEVYAIIAHLLELNGLAAAGQIVDAEYLSQLRMPNRDGFRSQID